LLGGDIAFLYEQSPKWERDKLRLTSQQLDRLRKEFALPKLAGIKLVSNEKTSVDALAGMARAEFHLSLPNGRIIPWYTNSVLTEEGPKFRFADVFNELWMLYYAGHHKEMPWGLTRMNSVTAGILADRSLLESIGVPGILGNSSSSKLIPWSTFEERILAGRAKFGLGPVE
jgi:hypothetical protein